jgi:hypothetical protein
MFTKEQRELAVLDEVSRILAEATSLEAIKAVRDKAEAARTYARAAQLGLNLQNRAAEMKLRAERRAGDFLKLMRLRGGDRRSKERRVTLKLEDMGISRQQSTRWQRVASITEEEFADYLKITCAAGREVTSAGLLRVARRPGMPLREEGLRNGMAVTTIIDVDASIQEVTSSSDVLDELMNHCRLLADILRPVCEEGDFDLERGERRFLGQLVREMSEMLQQLKNESIRTADAIG